MSENLFDPPPEMEAYVLAAFDDFQKARKKTSWRWMTMAAVAAAGCVAITVSIYAHRARRLEPIRVVRAEAQVADTQPVLAMKAASHTSLRRRRRVVKAVETEPEFVRIPYTTPLRPEERASLVRMDVPVAELMAAGLKVSTSDMGAMASAEVVVGEDGLARAVRVVSVSGY